MAEEGAGPDGAGVAVNGGGGTGAARNPGDQARPGSAQTGTVPCRDCGGTGLKDTRPCPTCGGSGQVVQIVGDA